MFAIDINPRCLRFATPRTQVDLVDQSDSNALIAYAKANGPFDIIIDDGSHMSSHQILSFETLWPYISPGGFYVVEDVETSYTGRYPNDRYIDCSPTCIEYFRSLIDTGINRLPKHRSPTYRDLYSITFKKNMIVMIKTKGV